MVPLRELRFRSKRFGHDISRETAEKVFEFCELFHVHERELPALIVLIKGTPEAYVMPVIEVDAVQRVRELLSAVREALEATPPTPFDPFLMMPLITNCVLKLRNHEDTIEIVVAKVSSKLEAMLVRHGATPSDRHLAAEFVANRQFSNEDLNTLFERFSFKKKILPNGYSRLRRDLARVRNLLDERTEIVALSERLESLESTVQQVRERRERVIEVLKARKVSRQPRVIIPTFNQRFFHMAQEFAERVNTWGDFGERAHSLLKLLTKWTGHG